MNRFVKITAMSVLAAATALAAVAPASAGDRWHRHGHRSSHSDGGDLVAAGILGLAVGAIVAGALDDGPSYREPIYDAPRRPVVRPRPVRPYYAEPSVVSYDALEPWSTGWYEYCGDRYRTFDPQTGTYVGYDGEEHFCVAN